MKTPSTHQLSKNIPKLPETKVEPQSRVHSAPREPTLGRISKTVRQYTFLLCESPSLGHFATLLDPEKPRHFLWSNCLETIVSLLPEKPLLLPLFTESLALEQAWAQIWESLTVNSALHSILRCHGHTKKNHAYPCCFSQNVPVLILNNGQARQKAMKQ